MTVVRTRWAAIGAAVAVTLGAGGVSLSQAAIGSGDKPVFVSITPCRLVDTRGNVGDRTTPLGAGDTLELQVTGSTGECSGVPSDAVAAALNVTAIQGSTRSFLTLYPADTSRPNASNVNWNGGDPPTPNKVDVKLSGGGAVKITNDAGSVHVAADLVGYYVDHTHDDRYYTETETDSALATVRSRYAGTVWTLAGSTQGFADDTGTNAQFSVPTGIAVAPDGTIYVADYGNDRIRKITPAGVVTTLAGSTTGYADGTGTSALFNRPVGIAVAPDGTIYVSDSNNDRIRKITPAGVVTTLAGSSAGSADGTGSSARFDSPYGLAVAPDGTIYVADVGNDRIRKITPAGVVTTLAGSTAGSLDGTGTSAQFDDPYDVAIAPDGTIYVADVGNDRIRAITTGGVVTTLAGSSFGYTDGTGTSAQFNNPFGLAVAPDGTIYVVGDNNRVRRVTAAGVVSTLAGSTGGFADGVGADAQFDTPFGIAIGPDGTMYVADYFNHRIRRVD